MPNTSSNSYEFIKKLQCRFDCQHLSPILKICAAFFLSRLLNYKYKSSISNHESFKIIMLHKLRKRHKLHNHFINFI